MIPLWLKIFYALFVCLLVPVYWRRYGASNFLWFSDIALLVTVPALWLESSMLASMMALAVLLPELAWNVDFLVRLLTGARFIGLSVYMFDPGIPRFLRALSLFHVGLPLLLLWMVHRLGYDERALIAQTIVAMIVLPLSYRFSEPRENINWVYGFGQKPQTRVPAIWYLMFLILMFPLAIYLPTHFILDQLFSPAGGYVKTSREDRLQDQLCRSLDHSLPDGGNSRLKLEQNSSYKSVMRQVKPPIAETRRPRFKLPPGACDTHLHIYGPFDRYPLAPERHYDPDPHSTLDDYLRVQNTLGLERAVIVTGSGNGTNNQITLDAIARMNGRFKGLAQLDRNVSDAELERLRSGGITGFRIKGRNPPSRGGMSVKETPRMIERTQGFGWHIEFMSESMQEVIATTPSLNSLNLPYVFDHVAHAEPDQHQNGDKEIAELIAILKNEEHAWINLYSFYQLSKSGAPAYADMVEVVQAIIAARPEHVVWGSNWPHASIRVPTPNDGDLVDFLLAAAPDEKIRNKILSENPAKLYGWK